jgi:carbon monoxide dehydrogenase subunit G
VKVEGTRLLAAPRERVWNVLNDPAQLAKTLPGVESFSIEDESRWTAAVKIPLGLGGLRLRIKFEKSEARAPEHARLHAKGQGIGAIVSLDTQFDLTPAGERTSMRWEADVRVAGQVGSMGQRVLQPIVNQQVANVLASLERQVAAAAPEGAETGLHPGSPEAYAVEPEGPTHAAG